MSAEIPSAAPCPGIPWERLLRLAEGAIGSHRGCSLLRRIDRPHPMGMPPMRCMPLGEDKSVTHRDLSMVTVNERIAYAIGMRGFSSGEGNAFHLWAIHGAAGPDMGEPLYVPLLPAPWWREDRDGAQSHRLVAGDRGPTEPLRRPLPGRPGALGPDHRVNHRGDAAPNGREHPGGCVGGINSSTRTRWTWRLRGLCTRGIGGLPIGWFCAWRSASIRKSPTRRWPPDATQDSRWLGMSCKTRRLISISATRTQFGTNAPSGLLAVTLTTEAGTLS